ncbi:sulfurtransferase TusA family protein [Sulfuracidifex metallicus]|jgi:TusA-related sulfurtransferase|uniref:Sulfurtransferase TusA family protein n=1 Tax=Sulfuracidifex metallicus DSM 6482 = JCM 9184 TaxID=523847 RepID=A0A6A9QP23_SULME|nr:sulfurtransferase TusA family protein [Sulfuracidifex metallicus]MCY0850758.1 sulfurtransferase TusA family protein [Sulfuracidifex metallicus]MUN29909.1 sulfurtransferase TusA family protein [Sulfuracidifex metallicus DSM 6482 = JCM 9184]WOE51707.1 sulfurtransferase TusA family protein [Sulfuracidifex metallicus DSM 6482 = JCM 9184]
MEEMDLTSLECPGPFMKVATKLMTEKNLEIRVLFKDSRCRSMILDAAKLVKCEILEDKSENGVFIISLRKNGTEPANEKDLKNLGGC